MTQPITLVANVTNGSTTVTVPSGAGVSQILYGGLVAVPSAGAVNAVGQITGTTTFELVLPYTGPTDTGVSMIVTPVPVQSKDALYAIQLLADRVALETTRFKAAAAAYDFTYDLQTAIANPGAGRLRMNNPDPSAATAIVISNETLEGLDQSALIMADANADDIFIDIHAQNFRLRAEVSTTTDNGAWISLNLSNVNVTGDIEGGQKVSLSVYRRGPRGLRGLPGIDGADGADGLNGEGGIRQIDVLTGSGTYTKPDGTNKLLLFGQAPGGGGSGASSGGGNARASSSGQAGAYAVHLIEAPDASYPYNCGSPGAGSGIGGNGGNATNLTFGGTAARVLNLQGGEGGTLVTSTADAYAVNGGSSLGAVLTGGNIVARKGAQGGGALKISAGVRVSYRGGDSPFGTSGPDNSASFSNISSAGQDGNGYGYGGNGAISATTSPAGGSNGGHGIIIAVALG